MRPRDPARAGLLDLVASFVPRLDRPLLVVVDGADGAGKTWFADELAQVLERTGHDVVRASVDDFHHPREHRHALGRTGETVWGRSFDYRALRRELLDPWCAGTGASYRRRWHDLASDELVDDPPAPVPERGVLLVDGVFAQREELHDCWDLVVWLEVPDEERVRRMAGRDGTPADGTGDLPIGRRPSRRRGPRRRQRRRPSAGPGRAIRSHAGVATRGRPGRADHQHRPGDGDAGQRGAGRLSGPAGDLVRPPRPSSASA